MPKNGRIRAFLRAVFGEGAPAGADPKPEAVAGEAPPPCSPSAGLSPAVSPTAPPEAGLAGPPPPAGAVEPPAASSDRIAPAQPGPQPPARYPPPEPLISAETLEELARLPNALHEVAEAIHSQTVLNERLQELLTSLAEPNQDLVHALEGLSSEGQRQTDLLQTLVGRLEEARQRDAQSADAVARLPELLESLRLSNTAVVEMMEQIRDRWASTKDDLAKEMVRQGRKTIPLVIAILAVVGVQTLLLIVRFLAGR